MKIKDIVSLETASVNPMNDANTYWYLYSLPSFDEGKQRECVLGSEIQSNKYIVPNKCILFNKLNVRFKRIWRVNDSDENKICSTEFLPLIVDEDIADFDYVYYLLNSERITSYLCGQNSNTSGSHKRIDPNNFLSIEVNLPSLEIQRNISSILVSLDSKIENNTKINQNLEAMAKQLYDYWFVQFDFPDENGKPYKSSGGKMVWNEKLKREIPEGWNLVQLEQLCNFRNGINYSKDEVGRLYKIVNVRNISSSRILLNGEDFDEISISESKASNYILTNKDIIIARSGCPGSTRLLLSPNNVLFCGFIICCTPSDIEYRNYITFALKQLEGTSVTTSGGSILQNVSQDTLKRLLVVKPPNNILEQFNNAINPLFEKLLNSLNESRELTKQRDELLPLLMNGQVSVINSD